MRRFFIICLALSSAQTFAQQTGKKYTFKEVNWTVTLPPGFTVIDSADDAARTERGKKVLEETKNTKLDISQTRTLISATKNTYNYFNATITPFNTKTDGSYEAANEGLKAMLFKSFRDKMSDANIDSSSTRATIDGLTFDEFHVIVAIKGKTLFNMFLLSKLYKGYDFGLSYLYLDEESKEQMEKMISGSKFTK
jgi:hypothetical protein